MLLLLFFAASARLRDSQPTRNAVADRMSTMPMHIAPHRNSDQRTHFYCVSGWCGVRMGGSGRI
ncbi:hypothetical protein M758_6G175600 [Ceratodon purpureus]|uniref:Secreted protein n=1 Tax=Ceratodon purpureus TaxID=3225 RepID=A0A8T0HJ22_CERPU|nr:hypothetical protein KC19_6G182600 [Ceratodon purpureus]KAG0614423.1 hypothetical protein M758_6G175600 [Ceratodon purpureus]